MNSNYKCFVYILLITFTKGLLAQDDSPFVVGGTNAAPGQIPYQASLRKSDGKHYCGGLVVSERWILTAAHCVSGITPAYVAVGSVYLSNGWTRYDVDQIKSHYAYNILPVKNDIALIKVKTNIVFTNFVKPVNLPSRDLSDGSTVIASGWGLTNASESTLPDNLQVIVLQTISKSDCFQKLFPTMLVYKSHLCTLTKAGEGVCMGDSGGPLVYDNVVYGVVSAGIPCAKGYPDVFTRVYSFKLWMKAIMALF